MHAIARSVPVLSTFSDEWKTGRFSDQSWESTKNVEVTTLDNLVVQYETPRYIKIDVEGYEKKVVSGLSQKIGVSSFKLTSEFFDNAKHIYCNLKESASLYFNLCMTKKKRLKPVLTRSVIKKCLT